jgi:hypothetical protein
MVVWPSLPTDKGKRLIEMTVVSTKLQTFSVYKLRSVITQQRSLSMFFSLSTRHWNSTPSCATATERSHQCCVHMGPMRQSKLIPRVLRTPVTSGTQFTTKLPKLTSVSLWYLRHCSPTRTYIGWGNWVHLAELRRCSTTRTHFDQRDWLYIRILCSPWKTRAVRSVSLNMLSLHSKPKSIKKRFEVSRKTTIGDHLNASDS